MNDPEHGRDPEQERAAVDRRFEEIVAGFEPAEADPPPQPPPDRPGPAADRAWRSWEGAEEEEHFVPAPTEPLPAGDLHFWGIVLGLTVGPLLVLLSAVAPVVQGGPWGVIGLTLSVVGFVLLILRSPRRGRGDEDSGAQV